MVFSESTLQKMNTFPRYKDSLNAAVISSLEVVNKAEKKEQALDQIAKAQQHMYFFTSKLKDTDNNLTERIVESFTALSNELTELVELADPDGYRNERAVSAQVKAAQLAYANTQRINLDIVDRNIAQEQKLSQLFNEQDLSRTSNVNWLLLTLLLVLLVGLSLILTEVISKPINRIRVAVEEMAKGNFTEAIELSSKDEIGELASSFKLMREQMRVSRDNLEHKVKERTKELENAMTDLEQKVKDRTRVLEEALQNSQKRK